MKVNGFSSNNSMINQSSADPKILSANVVEKSFESALDAAVNSKDDQKLKDVCKDFESILMNMMYKGMKATVPKSELIPEQSGRDIFESMLDDELVEQAAKRSSFGLAETLYKQLSQQVKSEKK